MLTERFDTALSFASKLHRLQVRKGTEIPYLGHLLAVAALVIEDGGSEDEAIAALLHDAIEDQGQYYPRGRDALRLYIRDQFGAVVASPDEAIGMMRSANIVSPPLFHYCPCCNEPVPHAIAYGLENLQKDEGNVVTVCFICEHKQVWTDLQAKARLRELIG
jgi:HD domain